MNFVRVKLYLSWLGVYRVLRLETPTIIGAKEKKNPKSHILDHVLKIPLGNSATIILIIKSRATIPLG